MGTVTGLTAARMLAIEDASVVSGTVDGTDHLILETHGGTMIDAGSVLGAAPETYHWNGSAYVKVDGAHLFIGPNDPASTMTVPDGSVWFDNA